MKIIKFIQSLKLEIHNICWPKFYDTMQITFTILFSSILLSLILWTIDKTLFFIISSIIHARF
ncbi:preprotein translocase subunit SecE [Buchnera aphidicola]|uniref:Preprotein translocase subunit SecE n=1 Tax=Buchnera aphidicola (Sarucallis kahawaluokalani) TaxID=1241878 RepID=A0A4D6YIM6_9GAMM|nr:preprotein translocase subunit SecE [Buchnera aphidicola (Sarucallis kahawaluokalani)]